MNPVTEEIDMTKKWIRNLTNVAIKHQLFPIYTSMEQFAIDGRTFRSLTDKELKSITFQVIPQLYWKYEWSFNSYMIHRVGKLESNSKEYQLYDMLGNVWEWVRDDWETQVSSYNDKTNPMVGDDTNK